MKQINKSLFEEATMIECTEQSQTSKVVANNGLAGPLSLERHNEENEICSEKKVSNLSHTDTQIIS